MAALEPVIATLVADIAQFQASMAEAKASMAELGASADTADAEGSLGALGAAGSNAGRDVKLGAEDAAAGLGGVSVAAKDAENAARDTEDATKDLGTAAADTGGKLSGAMSDGLSKMGNLLSNTGIPGVTSLGKSFERTGEEAEKLGSNAGSLFTSLAGVGKIATIGLGVALAGAAAEGIHLANNMQQAETSIANAAGISTAAAKSIGQAFLGTAGQSEFSGIQMAQAFGAVAGQLKSAQGAALTTSQSLQVMNAASDLATAKQIDLGSATTALATVMQAYGLKASDAGHATDVLYNTAQATGLGVSSITQTFQRLHATLGGLTPPIQQVGGLMLDLANHGESGRKSVSALNTALNTLIKPSIALYQNQQNLNNITKELPPNLAALAKQVDSGTISATALTTATKGLTLTQSTLFSEWQTASAAVEKDNTGLANLGITVINTQGKFVGMQSVITQLSDSLKGQSQAQQLATLTTAVGAGAAKQLLAVVQAGPAAFDKATEAAGKLGSAHAAAAKQAATFKTEMETLRATAEDLLTQFGQELLPVLTTVAGAFEHATSFIVKSKAALIALGVLVGGPLAVVIGAFIIQSIQKLISFVMDAGSTVAQFGSKLQGLTQPATQAGETVTKAGDQVTTGVEDMATSAETAATTFTGAMSTMGEAADALQATVSAAMTAIEGDIAAASANLSATVTETTTATGASGALGTAGGSGAAGAAGASGAAGAAGATTSAEAATSIFEPAVVALQGAAGSLETAAASLKEAAGDTVTAAGDTTAAAEDTKVVAADMATTDSDGASLDAADSADFKTAATALDGSASALDTAGEKLGLAGTNVAPTGTTSETESETESTTVGETVGEGVAASFLKGVAGKAIGGLIAVQLYNAFLEKPIGKKIGTDAASILGDAATGAAVGAAIAGPFGAAIGGTIAALYAAGKNTQVLSPKEKSAELNKPGAKGVFGDTITTGTIKADNIQANNSLGSNLGVFGDTANPRGRANAAIATTAPTLTPLQQDRAKDSTLQKQMAVISLLNSNVQAAKTADGTSSAQYKQALNALNTTQQKYFPTLGKDTSLAGVKLQEFAVSEQIGQLKVSAHADQVNGNQQLEAAQKAVTKLEGEAMTEKTGGASKAAIDLTNQQLTEAKSHLADIKSVVSDGTNAEHQIKSDTSHLSTLETLASTMSKVNSDTTTLHGDLTGVKSNTSDIHTAITGGMHTDLAELHTDLTGVHADLTGNGITISKLPSQSMKATGVLSLVLS